MLAVLTDSRLSTVLLAVFLTPSLLTDTRLHTVLPSILLQKADPLTVLAANERSFSFPPCSQTAEPLHSLQVRLSLPCSQTLGPLQSSQR